MTPVVACKLIFLDINHDGHIHRYGAPVFGNIVVYVYKPINNDDKILWRL